METNLSITDAALKRLRDGNQRYLDGNLSHTKENLSEHREQTSKGQHPFAAVISCADSRVPPELIFDCNIGELFTIRVAGNIIASSQTASIEYAVENLNTQLVVIMGHSGCGAVSAALADSVDPIMHRAEKLNSLFKRIKPAVESLLDTELVNDTNALMDAAVVANVRAAIDDLTRSSGFLREEYSKGKLRVVGAVYDLHTGRVKFL